MILYFEDPCKLRVALLVCLDGMTFLRVGLELLLSSVPFIQELLYRVVASKAAAAEEASTEEAASTARSTQRKVAPLSFFTPS